MAAAAEWEEHVPGGDCQCADGSEFSFWSREGDPEKVVLFFQGGGACFTAEMCSFTDGTYTVQADGSQVTLGSAGVFDAANEANPFRDYSFVFVPYCTGDIHLGDAVHDYGGGLTVDHKGYVNASAGLDYVVENFPDASEVFVTGSSAGGVPSPMFAGLASDALPDADIASLSDASGAYPSSPAINAAIGSLWGTFANVPDWPENEGLTPEDWGVPTLFVQAGLHDPDIRFARYDAAYDEVQQEFSDAAGLRGRRPLDDHPGQRGPDRGRRACPSPATSRPAPSTPSSATTPCTTSRWRACPSSTGSPTSSRATRSTTWSAPTARTPPTPDPGGPRRPQLSGMRETVSASVLATQRSVPVTARPPGLRPVSNESVTSPVAASMAKTVSSPEFDT